MNTGAAFFHELTLSDGTVFYLVTNARKGANMARAHDAVYRRYRQAFMSGEHAAFCPLARLATCYLSAKLTEE